MQAPERVRAWRPAVPGVAEVLHAHFTEHAYPAHTHDHWTVLLVDTGGVDYLLGRDGHRAPAGSLTILPPDVPHDGQSARVEGFDKRVVYLDERWLPLDLVARVERDPLVRTQGVRRAVADLHDALGCAGDELESESRLALVAEAIGDQLRRRDRVEHRAAPRVARLVRDRLDAALDRPPTLSDLAAELEVHPTHVVRAFAREFGVPPHQYVLGRRLDHARRLLLDGVPAAQVATETGFFDQAHLTRHFRRLLGVTPGVFARRATEPAPPSVGETGSGHVPPT
ncbi:AraC family transcriptional regulator [Aeromicrobium sp. CF4.19]|uniref:helix-turn-helix transcriptional regulator n=1 Tax=Aeromicrobium sp. CF4.19 TaxID=3373082 RepID=UPI003EE546B8